MQSLKVIQISIVEWILIVPFNFQREGTVIKDFHMVNGVTGCLSLPIIYKFPYLKLSFRPFLFFKCLPQSLRNWRFAVATAHKLFNLNREASQYIRDIFQGVREVIGKNCLSV